MTTNEWGGILSTTEKQTARIDTISIFKRMRAKFRRCLSDEPSSQKL